MTKPNRLSRQIEACGVRVVPKMLPPERRSGRRSWNLRAFASTVQMGTQCIRGSADRSHFHAGAAKSGVTRG